MPLEVNTQRCRSFPVSGLQSPESRELQSYSILLFIARKEVEAERCSKCFVFLFKGLGYFCWKIIILADREIWGWAGGRWSRGEAVTRAKALPNLLQIISDAKIL